MNEFQYRIMLKEIEAMTTQKAREKVAREMVVLLKSARTYREFSENIPITDTIRIYKLLTKVISLYTAKHGLPSFIHSMCNITQYNLINFFNNIENSVTYDMFINTFEFNNTINVGSGQIETFKPLIELIGSNTLPFEISIRPYSSAQFTYMLGPNLNFNILPLTLEIEQLKRTLNPKSRYTLLEQMLDTMYTELKSSDNSILAFTADATTLLNEVLHSIRIVEERINV